MNFKKKLWEALDIITNSISHKQIVFQRNKSLESGVPYYVFRLTSLELKNIYLLLVSGHWPWCRGDPQKLWSFMVFMLEQPKIRPRIHNGRSSYMQYVYIYTLCTTNTYGQYFICLKLLWPNKCLLCEAKICHPNLIPWLQSATLRYKLQACEASSREEFSHPHILVCTKQRRL